MTSVQYAFGAIIDSILDKIFHAHFCSLSYKRTDLSSDFSSSVYLEGLCAIHNFVQPVEQMNIRKHRGTHIPGICVSDEYSNRDGHTSLTRCSKSCSDDRVDGVSFVTIRKYDSVIFGSEIGLYPFSTRTTSGMNILSSFISSNKRYGFDIGCIT